MIIPYQKFSIKIKALDDLFLPNYKGSTFRGGFGNAFKRVVCPLKEQQCNECPLREKCVYFYVFETSPDENSMILNMNKYEKVPHPFVIEPPLQSDLLVKKLETISFGLILIGNALDYLPYFIYTFERLGEIGIGKGRGKFSLVSVNAEEKVVYNKGILIKTPIKKIEIFDKFSENNQIISLSLRFLTPVRIKYNRDFVDDLDFHILIRNLLRRLSLLGFFHCGKQSFSFNIKDLINLSENIKKVQSNLKWFDWERYSSRQKTKMFMGGLVGEVTYEGDITPFIEILKAGEILHVGKGTSFGLGKYELIFHE